MGSEPLSLADLNPYQVPPGPELDKWVESIFRDPGPGYVPPYSTDEASADRLKADLKGKFGVKVLIGQTRIRKKPWFARYGTDPSTSTEVVAETYPLALSRLALIMAVRLADYAACLGVGLAALY